MASLIGKVRGGGSRRIEHNSLRTTAHFPTEGWWLMELYREIQLFCAVCAVVVLSE